MLQHFKKMCTYVIQLVQGKFLELLENDLIFFFFNVVYTFCGILCVDNVCPVYE